MGDGAAGTESVAGAGDVDASPAPAITAAGWFRRPGAVVAAELPGPRVVESPLRESDPAETAARAMFDRDPSRGVVVLGAESAVVSKAFVPERPEEPAVSAKAIGIDANAAHPTPSATASAPTRPTFAA